MTTEDRPTSPPTGQVEPRRGNVQRLADQMERFKAALRTASDRLNEPGLTPRDHLAIAEGVVTAMPPLAGLSSDDDRYAVIFDDDAEAMTGQVVTALDKAAGLVPDDAEDLRLDLNHRRDQIDDYRMYLDHMSPSLSEFIHPEWPDDDLIDRADRHLAQADAQLAEANAALDSVPEQSEPDLPTSPAQGPDIEL